MEDRRMAFSHRRFGGPIEAQLKGFGNHLAVLLFPETSPHLKPWEAINTRIREWECDKRVQLQSTMFRCPLPSHKGMVS
ncbi:hypothetical protein L2E82_11387 [Cichorium intybus]|uniref:Uncharacterized protein n=1 Tax=Cichorium intybus TaxID=13427 RepID=A0ACB9GCN0_CICIN|nr:hypothetical protein L2E82_11387 [Cichorium intybus]